MTYSQGFVAFILADTVLAAKLDGQSVKISSLSQKPDTANNAVIRIVSNVSWSKLDGATSATTMRVEVTFWCASPGDAETLANRFREIASGLNGPLAASGPVFKTVQTHGPRATFNPESRFHGSQIDIIGNADMSTAS